MGEKENKTIIFCETKRKTDDITRQLRRDGWPAMCIHGDKSQPEREWVLKEFRSGKSPILIATDVASRGLDIPDINFVVNFDYPNSGEDYIHRIGRTARADRTGTAYTFFTQANGKNAAELVSVMQEAGQVVPPKLSDLAKSSYGGRKRARYSSESDDHGGKRHAGSSRGSGAYNTRSHGPASNYGSSSRGGGSSRGGSRGGQSSRYSGSSSGGYNSSSGSYGGSNGYSQNSSWQGQGRSDGGYNQSYGSSGSSSQNQQYNSQSQGQGQGSAEQWAKYQKDMQEWQQKNQQWQAWQQAQGSGGH